jgi:release factor glutamine methyltransferase
MIYQPKEDSYLLEEQVKKFSNNKSVLDMGSGSGIQALAALSSGAKSILAADINPEVIEELKKKDIPVVKSDLFSRIKEKFDIIVFNPPYLPLDKREDKESSLTTSGGKKGDELIIKFLRQSVTHLNKKGFILLLISSLTPEDKILELLKKLNLNKSILSEKKFFMETLKVWKIAKN